MNTRRSLMAGIFMLVALMTVPVMALAAISNAIDSDLVGLWRMDGNWGDSSGNENHGIPYNVAMSSTDKKIGTQAGVFNGANSYVSVPNSTSLNTINSMTIELWAKSNINWDAHTNWVYLVHKRNLNYSGYGIYIDSDNPRVVFSIINTGGVGSHAVSSNLLPNTWYHIVGTYDGSDIKIYINGQLQNSVPATGTISTNTLNLEIGRWRGEYNEYVNGLIDEVAIYKRALSATEIQEHYRTYAVTPPTVNPITSPTATSTIVLSGTKPANTAIAVNGNTLVPLDGTTIWQAAYALSPGTNYLTVTALDSQNLNSLPAALTVVLDTAPPQVTATMPSNNGILKVAPGSVSLTLTDAVSPLDYTATLYGASVKNASGSNISGTWSNSRNGTSGIVTFTPTATLPEGTYTVIIKPTDTVANGSTYTLTFTVDSTPPVAPGIDPVTAPVNTTSKTITGTRSSDSASVAVSCAGAAIGPVSYPTAATWSVNISGLREGDNSITAYAVDAVGNQSATATETFTVDTTPPVVGATPAGGIYRSTPSIALAVNEQSVIYYTMDGSTPTASATMYHQPISIPSSVTLKYFARDLAGNISEITTENYVIDTTPPVLAISTLSDGAYTNNETLNIAGTVMDHAGVKELTVNGTAIPVNADGSFSYALLLKNGVNGITVAATDSVDNMAADTRTVTLDQTAPVLDVTTPADNSKTGKMLLELSGTVDETSVVTVKVKDSVQSAAMNGGTFTAPVILESGYNTIEITAADLAGNRSTAKRTVVFDDQMPSLAVTTPNQDLRTNHRSLTIRGTAHDTLTAVGVTISKDNEVLTLPVIDGTFEQVVNFTEEKTYGIVVTATNEVGTSTTVQRNVIFDITPPALAIYPVTSPTTQANQSIYGTREPGATVTVTCPTATAGTVVYPTGTTWQVELFGLAEGANTITATSADEAGNVVSASATVVFAPKTTAPTITLTVSPDLIWSPNNKLVPVTISGGVEANGTVITSVAITVRDEYGKCDYSNLRFGSVVMLDAWRKGTDKNGREYTVTVTVTDRNGQTTTKSASVTVPHKAPPRTSGIRKWRSSNIKTGKLQF